MVVGHMKHHIALEDVALAYWVASQMEHGRLPVQWRSYGQAIEVLRYYARRSGHRELGRRLLSDAIGNGAAT